MSQSDVQAVLGRAATDSEFRNQLMGDAASALAEYDLSDEERDALSNLQSETLSAFAESLDDRISKGFSKS
jgi:hypothetical protein